MVWWLLTGIGVLVGLLLARGWQKRRAARLRLEGRTLAFNQLRLLRELLEQTQRHRGLCFGVMSGAHALESDRWTVNANVIRLLERAEGHRVNLIWHDALNKMGPLWDQIERARHTQGALQVLQLHHELTSLILATIEALGDRHDLICLGGLAPQPEGLWLDLLKNAELLGKVRAVGTGIAARRQNNEVQHQELERLRQLVCKQLYLAPAKLSVEPAFRDALAKPVREAEDRVDALLQAIDALLRDPLHPALRSRAFFNIATQAINAQYMLADLLIDHLRRNNELALRQG